MNLKTWSVLAMAVLGIAARPVTAETFRTDINPALLYWQAFAVIPDLPAPDQQHLLEKDWRNAPMDERAGQLALRFDPTFRLLRQAAASTVLCDWGVDLSPGPRVLLSHLAKAKWCAQTAALRSRWFVQHGRPEAARDDLIAAFVLGRNLSQDNVLISALVQIAVENIVTGYMVQQWPELDTATIGSLLAAFDKAPPRGTIAACMKTEKTAFHDWFVRELEELRTKHAADEPRALALASDLLNELVSEDNQARTEFGPNVIAASGKSMTGLIQYVHQLEPFYAELDATMRLPYAEFEPAIERLEERIASDANLLLHEFFPALLKVRLKEFRSEARLAMVHAGYRQRLDPVNGWRLVRDPFGVGPFEYSRFGLEGIDRGFKLKSHLRMPEFDEVQIFAEKPGPAFFIDGPRAGQPVP